MSSQSSLRVISAYKGMTEYIRLARGTDASTQEQLWMELVIEPYWSEWAAGQFNEARTRKQLKKPIADMDALSAQVDLLASAAVETLLEESYEEITRRLPSPLSPRAVCVYPLPAGHGHSEGVEGTCIGDNILLRIDPVVRDWRPWARFVLAHEYHHTVWGYNYFGVRRHTSMDFLTSILTDGQADSFARSLYPHLVPSWLQALSPAEEMRQWHLMQPHLAGNDDAIYRRFMFGDEGSHTPSGTGYTIAYHIVQAYLSAHPGTGVLELLDMEPWVILKESGYDPS